MKSSVLLVQANARHIPLPDESVQCCVTSPPYWGLRKYAGSQDVTWSDGWCGAYGLEPTVEMYIAHTVEILREVKRVLREDGVCFWNIGDSYAGSGKGATKSGNVVGAKQATVRGSADGVPWLGLDGESGLKPKDLCLIPFRVALAAQADGWWVRSAIIWSKPNPMPESVTDRPTDAYEHIFMFTKSPRYFWDAEAVSEQIADSTVTRVALAEGRKADAQADIQSTSNGGRAKRCESARVSRDTYADDHLVVAPKSGRRNLRNVWNFATQPYSGAHFATFPEELPRRCIRAATSERGACRMCGAPWERVTRKAGTESWKGSKFDTGKTAEHQGNRMQVRTGTAYERESNPGRIALLRQQARENGGEYVNASQTIGWRPGCTCPGQHGRTVPCLVLDPFGGSGTTGRVAVELNRKAVLCDLAYGGAAYESLATRRTAGVQRQLLSI